MQSDRKIISRIAPTPSGFLHLGNAFNFTFTYLLARSNGGDLHLRIDDIDATRTRPEFIEDIFRTLDWLKIEWDYGPNSPDDFYKNHSQLKRIDEYRSAVEQLFSHTYHCKCSRKTIKEKYLDGLYRGACKNANIEYVQDETSLRLEIPESEECFAKMGHPVIWRKDDLPAYNLVSVIDDLRNNINTIVRGEDLLSSTSLQKYIAKLLKRDEFEDIKFIHHALLQDAEGKKLSKSDGALSMKQLIDGGKSYNNFLHDLSHYFELPFGNSLDEIIKKIRLKHDFKL